MTIDNTPPTPRSKLASITDALARRDNAALLALLDDHGGDANWCDDRGQTLLHFAALRGDEELCEALIFTKGFDAHARNEDGDTPARTAAIFGHERLAEHLAEIASAQPPAATLPAVSSLADLRALGKRAGSSQFYRYACFHQFAAVIAAAVKNDESFTRDDLLAMGQKGESVALRLAQSGQLAALLRAPLWRSEDSKAVLQAVRDSLPQDFRAVIDSAEILAKAQPAGPALVKPASGAGRRFRFDP